jgi:hypothetical protein
MRDDPRAVDVDATLGGRATVDARAPAIKVSYVVARALSAEERAGDIPRDGLAEERLSPSLFYRGHIFGAHEPIKVGLEPLKKTVFVFMQEDPKTIPKGFRNQFRYHPDEGYIHYNEDLKYEIVVKNLTKSNQSVFLEYELEDDKKTEHHELKIGPKGFKAIPDWIRGVDTKNQGQKVPGSREVDLARPRHLEVKVWDSPARMRPLATRRFRFTHIDVDQYATSQDMFYDRGEGKFWILVRHLGSDKGKGYINDVTARVAGLTQAATHDGQPDGKPCLIDRNHFYGFWFTIDPDTPVVDWSVRIGKKSNAYGGTYTINEGAKKKQEQDKEKQKADAPKL